MSHHSPLRYVNIEAVRHHPPKSYCSAFLLRRIILVVSSPLLAPGVHALVLHWHLLLLPRPTLILRTRCHHWDMSPRLTLTLGLQMPCLALPILKIRTCTVLSSVLLHPDAPNVSTSNPGRSCIRDIPLPASRQYHTLLYTKK